MTKAKGPALPSLEDTYEYDEAKAEAGVWFNFGAFGFKMRHVDTTSPRYMKIRERVTRPFRQQIDRETLDPKQDKRLSVRIFVEAFLVDWRTNEIDDLGAVVGTLSPEISFAGQPTPFTVETGTDALVKLPKLFQNLTFEAANVKNYRYDAEAEKTDLGN